MIDQVETPLDEIEREAEMLKYLAHPTVVKLHDVYYEKVFVCMVLDFYKGGDMIQGMMAHWKTKGMIPMSSVRILSKQMHTAVAWVHANACAHRDVKGDNFMMKEFLVENPQQLIFLSDFGTVCKVIPGQRMTQKCGTKNYWPPEFYRLNYTYKVDCWAVGVVMFGLVSGKFPFKVEEDVKYKKLVVQRKCPDGGGELIHAYLERDEDKRWECAAALQHPFLKEGGEDLAVGAEKSLGTAEKFDADNDHNIKETGIANAGVQLRRAELVDRLQGGGKPGSGGSGMTSNVVFDGSKAFTVRDPVTERSTTFEWWSAAKVTDMVAATQRGEQMPTTNIINRDVTAESVKQQLVAHDIKVTGFGTGKAKPFSTFVTEIQ